LEVSAGDAMPSLANQASNCWRRGLSASRRERIEPAVATGGKHVTGLYEAWISVDTRWNVKVMVTGPQGFERRVMFEFG
jgi:hypothetical protein